MSTLLNLFCRALPDQGMLWRLPPSLSCSSPWLPFLCAQCLIPMLTGLESHVTSSAYLLHLFFISSPIPGLWASQWKYITLCLYLSYRLSRDLIITFNFPSSIRVLREILLSLPPAWLAQWPPWKRCLINANWKVNFKHVTYFLLWVSSCLSSFSFFLIINH